MKERLLRYGRFAAFPAFYVLCLAIFAPLTFPYDELKQRIAFSFNDDQRATGGQQELHIESLDGYWLSGVRMKGVQLLSASSEAVWFDELTVGVTWASPQSRILAWPRSVTHNFAGLTLMLG